MPDTVSRDCPTEPSSGRQNEENHDPATEPQTPENTKMSVQDSAKPFSKPEKLKAKTVPQITRGIVLPGKPGKTEPAICIPPNEAPEQNKMEKHEWNLVLNHASSDELTKLAQYPYIDIPSLNQIKTTKAGTTCTGCMKGKLKNAAHKRTVHRYDH